MSQFSDYAENEILNWILGKKALTQITAYVGLYSVAPTDAGGGTELSGSGYARAEITSKMPTASGSGGSVQNNALIEFPTASGNWATAVAFGIFDAPSGGNLLMHASLAANVTVSNGGVAQFDTTSNRLTVTVA